jgi:hypothetical protein
MKAFLSSTEFQVGFFSASLITALLFTVILVNFYTSNDLLSRIGFHRNGKVYTIVEMSQHKQEQYYERRR